MKYFRLIWSNMWRKRIRTTLTILSVFVAFVLFGLLSAFKDAFAGSNSTLEDAERLITIHKISLINFLPISYSKESGTCQGSLRQPTRPGSALTTKKKESIRPVSGRCGELPGDVPGLVDFPKNISRTG